MKLRPVTVTRADSCITYMLKRIGYPYDHTDVVNREWLFALIEKGTFVKVKRPRKGDVGIYHPTEHSSKWVPVSIDADGRISSQHIPLEGFHTVVYEGKECISDLTTGHDHPVLRYRKLEDVGKQPTYWVRLR